MVKDVRSEQPQHLTLEEAQRLMGMPPGCTAGNGATVDEQLTAIGNGWDMNVVRIIMSRSKLCSLGNAQVAESSNAQVAESNNAQVAESNNAQVAESSSALLLDNAWLCPC